MVRELLILIAVMCNGCSALLERSSQYSKYKIEGGYQREQILEELGQPHESTVEMSPGGEVIIDTYIISGRVFDCGDYWGATAGWVMTFGLHELLLFPISMWEVISESIYPKEKFLEIRYVDNNYRCQYEIRDKAP